MTEWQIQKEQEAAALEAFRAKRATETSPTGGYGIGELGSVPETTALDEIEAERLQPSPKANGRCAMCGQTVPKAWLMGSNYNGSVCPDCYDSLPEG